MKWSRKAKDSHILLINSHARSKISDEDWNKTRIHLNTKIVANNNWTTGVASVVRIIAINLKGAEMC